MRQIHSRRAVKKIDKDQFLSIRSILSIIAKNFNLSIVINFYQLFEYLPIFPKKATFLEKIGEKIFRGHDHFLEGVILL